MDKSHKVPKLHKERGHKIQPHLILRRLSSLVLKCFVYEVGLNSIKVFYYSRYSQQSYQIALLRLTSIVKGCLLGRSSQFIQSNLVKYSKSGTLKSKLKFQIKLSQLYKSNL